RTGGEALSTHDRRYRSMLAKNGGPARRPVADVARRRTDHNRRGAATPGRGRLSHGRRSPNAPLLRRLRRSASRKRVSETATAGENGDVNVNAADRLPKPFA